MAGDGRVLDGHTFLFGMDGDTDPSALKPSTSAKSVNRVFRGGKNRTRPPFLHKPFLFDEDSEQYRWLVTYGNFQGWTEYRKRKPGREDGIVVAIAGKIFFLTLVNEKFYCRFIVDGNDPRLLHTWFVQAEEWLYIQNGKERPIFWNGLLPSSARRSDASKNEMPVGTVMAYAHGRIFLSNAFDQIAASDIIHGNGLTKSDAPQKFTENLYWNEGGYFGQPTYLGEITGMIVLARQDDRLNGQGELVILSEEGATAIEAGISRSQWKNTKIQTVTLTGRGAVAPASLINVNNDCWFRSDDGISSYQISRSEQKRQLSFGKLSRHVNPWLENDTPWLLRYASSIYFNNRIITTVSPMLGTPEDPTHGSHRFHRGMVVLDLDQASDVQGDSPFNWDGLWTGIRPTALLKFSKRAFAFSYDSDGVNRIYEISKSGLNDIIEDTQIKTDWFYLSKRFDWVNSQKSNEFEVKKLVGGELWISEVRDRIDIGADYRPDNSPYWNQIMGTTPFGSDFQGDYKFSHPRYKRFKFPSPVVKTECGAPYPSNHGSQHQIMVYGSGQARVDRMRVAMAPTNDPNSPIVDCKVDDPKTTLDSEGKLDDEFSYDIAEKYQASR